MQALAITAVFLLLLDDVLIVNIATANYYRSAGCIQSNLVHIDLKNNIDADVNIGTQNVRSAGGKCAAICESIESCDTDILVLTETWHEPNDTAVLNSITPAGYSFVDRARPIARGARTNSTSFHNHGGIAIIYRSSLSVQQLTLNLDI